MEKWKSKFEVQRGVSTVGTCLAANLALYVLVARVMATSDLLERTHLFALSVLKFCRRLPRTPEAQEAAGQLRRAANSVRSNYRAARRGRSRAEFQAKLGTVFEEADECAGWLEYLRDGSIQHDPTLVEEAQALARIFAKAVKTARLNTRRLKNLPDS